MSANLRVLLLADDSSAARLVTDALHGAGLAVHLQQLRTESEFLAALRPDVDVVLAADAAPGLDTSRVLALLSASGLAVPLIVINGRGGDDRVVEALHQGASDYVSRDQPGRLGRAVSRALELRRQREARCRADAEAAQWRDRYDAAILASGQLLYDWDPHTDEVVYGGDIERIVGYTEAELAGGLERWLKCVHPDDVGAFVAMVERIRVSGESCHHEYRVVRKGGDVIHCEARGHFMRDAAGRITRMVGFLTDISQRKKAEQELSDSRRILEMVLNTIPIGVFWKDRQSRYLGCNRHVSDAFGLKSPEDIIGKTDFELPCLKRAEAEFFVRTDQRLMESDTSQFGIIEPATLANGNSIWMETSKTPMHDDSGRVVGVLGVWQDVTERQRLEEQLRHSMKMEAVGRLAGGIAHDFNNLLTVINGYSDILLGQICPNEPHHDLVAQVRKAGRRAGGLTRQLLAFSRKTVLVPVVVDLNALLADMEKLLAPLLGEDVELSVRPGANLWRVKVDPGEMGQVVMNLCVNARDAMPRGGKLTVETANVELDAGYAATRPDARAGEHVVLAVSDTGCGMDSATRARIFEPFFTTKGPEKGTGLGLAMVYGIIKQSGGHIEVYSEPNLGSTFKIYLPRVRSGEPLARSAQGVRPPAPRGTETVLLTEDEEGVRKLTRLVLERNGYKVLEAPNGQEALRLCDEKKDAIQLLITDVVMPNLSGPQLAEEVRRRRPGLKVLYLSGYTDDAIVRHGILEGAAPFLQKPFSPDSLAQKVRDVLDG